MPLRRLDASPQTRAVLRALAADPRRWLHGYDLSSSTGLRSGTLYPMLARLADRGVLEAIWEPDAPEGRPRRHLYRLTAAGADLVARLPAEPARLPRRHPAPRPATGRA